MEGPARTSRDSALLFAAFLALCVSWLAVLPAFAGPDEPSNFIKAAAIIRGDFVGTPIPPDPFHVLWSTYVDIDPRFGTAQQVPYCYSGNPTKPAACAPPMETLPVKEPTRTQMGRYPLVGFLPASIGTLLGPSSTGALAARTTSAIGCCAFLCLAGWLLIRTRRSLAPLFIAVTPGVMFLSSVDSPSGFEICAAIAAWVAAWCCISDGWNRRDSTAVFAISSGALVLARPAGLVTLGVMVLASLIADWRGLLRGLTRHVVPWAGLGCAAAGTVAWYLAVYDDNLGTKFELDYRVTSFGDIFRRTLSDLPLHFANSVGNFGWLDTPSPTLVVWLGVCTTAGFTWHALRQASRAQRIAIAAVMASVPVWATSLNASYQDLIGQFGVQGRHLTPLIVGAPLAVVAFRRPQRTDLPITFLSLGAHMWCVFVAMRRYVRGVADPSWFSFLHLPVWIPPLGIAGTVTAVIVAHAAAGFLLARVVGRMER